MATRTVHLGRLAFVVLVLSSICLATRAFGETLQYDDGSWNLRCWGQEDAAVRFTPSSNLHVASISAYMCYAQLYGTKFPVTVTIWGDNAGAMGNVLFSEEADNWVGDPDTWNTFEVGLSFAPGESFWAGFTSTATNNSFGLFVDTSAPDGRSYWDLYYDSSGWIPVEPVGSPGDLLIRANMTPEPASLCLLALGGLALLRRRK